MILKHDCVRDVLLAIEALHKLTFDEDEQTIIFKSLPISNIYEALPQYSQEDVFYTIFNLEQAGYIDANIKWADNALYACQINHMTYSGHEILNIMREEMIWQQIKKTSKKIGISSLNVLVQIGQSIATSGISKLLEPS